MNAFSVFQCYHDQVFEKAFFAMVRTSSPRFAYEFWRNHHLGKYGSGDPEADAWITDREVTVALLPQQDGAEGVIDLDPVRFWKGRKAADFPDILRERDVVAASGMD